jgi:dATP/dGTP diphosphohydrolase
MVGETMTWRDQCGCEGIYDALQPAKKLTTYACFEHIKKIYETGMLASPVDANPKDLVGSKKVSMTKLPAIAQLHGNHAMMYGAKVYGPYNWREKKVQAEIYVDAALRHITAWNEREECASDSHVHHLGHAMACLAILLDAQETGNLIDNRPTGGEAYTKVLDRLNKEAK